MERREKCMYKVEERRWSTRNELTTVYKKECGARFYTEDEDRIKDVKKPNFCDNCGGRLVKGYFRD